jgi:hypothetical protein
MGKCLLKQILPKGLRKRMMQNLISKVFPFIQRNDYASLSKVVLRVTRVYLSISNGPGENL